MKRQHLTEEKRPLYVAVIEQARDLHPGMGLRQVYNLMEPEGIGRDAFILLGIEEGFLRLK